MDVTQWVAVLGGFTGFVAVCVTAWKTWNDRKAGIDSKEISSGELELAQDNQAWTQLVEIVNQLKTDRDDLRARVAVLEAKLGDQAVEIARLIDVIREKDVKIAALTADIIVLLEHINSGRQPPPPVLRGYRGEEETHA